MKISILFALLALVVLLCMCMNTNMYQTEKKDCCAKPEVMGVYMPPTDTYPVDSRPNIEYTWNM